MNFEISFILSFLLAVSSPLPSNSCPQVSVECISIHCCTSPFVFVANIRDGNPPRTLSYKWSISAGKIISGQGTSSIKVSATRSEMVTATVEITGLNAECPYTASASQAICDPPPPIRLFDEYSNLSSAKERYRLDRFANELRNYPGAQGYIVVYGRACRAEIAKNYLIAHHNLDPGRIVIVENKSRDRKGRIKLYVVPTGAVPPKAQSAPPNKALQLTAR